MSVAADPQGMLSSPLAQFSGDPDEIAWDMRQDRANNLLLLTDGPDAVLIYNITPYAAEKTCNVPVCEARLVKGNRRAFGQTVLNLLL